ncbi:MAG TPA: M48 family metalloprotease [Thermoguttaceae bacterium]|nr:M48 family metalloprotease [Thermoguttaceae bacterium]
MVVNAAVTGFWPRLRYVFLTDGLLEWLDNDQIAAVFGHELAHVRHRHLWLRAAAMLIPLSLGLFVFYGFPGLVREGEIFARSAGLNLDSWFAVPALVGMIAYVLTFFGFYSRCLEYEADLAACRSIPTDEGVLVFCSALERLAAACGNRRSRTWQHGSIARRVDFLESVRRAPELGLRFDRRVRLLGGIVIGLSLSPLICLLVCSCLLG